MISTGTIEILPVSFDIDLAAPVPRLEVMLYGVNHLRKTLSLDQVVGRFFLRKER